MALIIFYIVTALEFITFIPQIYRLLKIKSSADISIASQLIYLIMSFGWVIYWILTDVTIGQLIMSLVLLTENIVQVFLVLIYRKGRNVERLLDESN